MKNVLFFAFVLILLSACSKESDNLGIDLDDTAELSFANFRVGAIVAGSHLTSTNSPCTPVGIPNTEIGLFFEKDMDISGDLTTGEYHNLTGTGSSLFYKIKPGSYTVIVKNHLGLIKLVEQVQAGESEIVVQF